MVVVRDTGSPKHQAVLTTEERCRGGNTAPPPTETVWSALTRRQPLHNVAPLKLMSESNRKTSKFLAKHKNAQFRTCHNNTSAKTSGHMRTIVSGRRVDTNSVSARSHSLVRAALVSQYAAEPGEAAAEAEGSAAGESAGGSDGAAAAPDRRRPRGKVPCPGLGALVCVCVCGGGGSGVLIPVAEQEFTERSAAFTQGPKKRLIQCESSRDVEREEYSTCAEKNFLENGLLCSSCPFTHSGKTFSGSLIWSVVCGVFHFAPLTLMDLCALSSETRTEAHVELHRREAELPGRDGGVSDPRGERAAPSTGRRETDVRRVQVESPQGGRALRVVRRWFDPQ